MSPGERDARDQALEYLGERLAFVIVHSEVAQREAASDQVAALGYALQRAKLQLNEAIDAYNKLRRTGDEARHEAA